MNLARGRKRDELFPCWDQFSLDMNGSKTFTVMWSNIFAFSSVHPNLGNPTCMRLAENASVVISNHALV